MASWDVTQLRELMLNRFSDSPCQTEAEHLCSGWERGGEVLVITVTALFSCHCSGNGMMGLTNGITSCVSGPTKHLERRRFAQILVKTKNTWGESVGTAYVIFPADAKNDEFLTTYEP